MAQSSQTGANRRASKAGAGLAVAAAAAAGAYWLYGSKDAAKHRKQAKGWMLRARAEVVDALEKAKDIDKAQYMALVDKIAKGYSAAASAATGPQMRQLLNDLRSGWKYVAQQKAVAVQKGARAKKSVGAAVRKGSSTRSKKTSTKR